MKAIRVILLILLLILGTASSAGCWWLDEDEKTDVRLYTVLYQHEPELAKRWPAFVITDVWIDPSGYIIFVDWNADGVEDGAHIHEAYFYLEDGTPVIFCHGNTPAKEAREFINNWIRNNSA